MSEHESVEDQIPSDESNPSGDGDLLNGTWELRMVLQTHSEQLKGTLQQLVGMDSRMRNMSMDMFDLRRDVIVHNVAFNSTYDDIKNKISKLMEDFRERDKTFNQRLENIENELKQLNGH